MSGTLHYGVGRRRVTGELVAGRLRAAADADFTATGTSGAREVELPLAVWERLLSVAGRLPYVAQVPEPEFPWTEAVDRGPIRVETMLGTLVCWPPGKQVVSMGAPIDFGGSGNPDGDTKEG